MQSKILRVIVSLLFKLSRGFVFIKIAVSSSDLSWYLVVTM